MALNYELEIVKDFNKGHSIKHISEEIYRLNKKKYTKRTARLYVETIISKYMVETNE